MPHEKNSPAAIGSSDTRNPRTRRPSPVMSNVTSRHWSWEGNKTTQLPRSSERASSSLHLLFSVSIHLLLAVLHHRTSLTLPLAIRQSISSRSQALTLPTNEPHRSPTPHHVPPTPKLHPRHTIPPLAHRGPRPPQRGHHRGLRRHHPRARILWCRQSQPPVPAVPRRARQHQAHAPRSEVLPHGFNNLVERGAVSVLYGEWRRVGE